MRKNETKYVCKVWKYIQLNNIKFSKQSIIITITMDLNQRKLKKSEWDSIEIPVSSDEVSVLNLIKEGYHNVNVKVNKGNSIFTFLKIGYNVNTFPKIEEYLFNKYLRSQVDRIEAKIINIEKDLKIYNYKKISVSGITRLNSADKIRLEKSAQIE